jgi:hypothetical protein
MYVLLQLMASVYPYDMFQLCLRQLLLIKSLPGVVVVGV